MTCARLWMSRGSSDRELWRDLMSPTGLSLPLFNLTSKQWLTEIQQADSASPSCDSPTCRSSFGLFLRRHHCRHCGHVFCSSHTPHVVPLDQDARFHPEGVPSRACDLCWLAFQRWEESRSERLNKIQTQIDAQNTKTEEVAEETPEHVDNIDEESRKALAAMLGQSTEIAASIPRGWNWSTF